MTLYLVIGRLEYREHPPGRIFEADLDPAAEQRAVERGNIEIIDSSPTRIRPGSYTLPPPGRRPQAHNRAPSGALLIEGGIK
jgi:hypothetical protein